MRNTGSSNPPQPTGQNVDVRVTVRPDRRSRRTPSLRTAEPGSGRDLPLFSAVDGAPKVRQRRAAQVFLRYAMLNPNVAAILDRLPGLGVDAWLVSGCLVQSIWNLRLGRSPQDSIADYDLIYCDPDPSWEAEDRIIRRAAALFGDLRAEIQIRNQTRVPLWYAAKFGCRFPPVRQARHAVLRYPARTTAIAVTRQPAGYAVYAPFGLSDAMRLRVRPNRRLPLADVYAAKTRRWQAAWPELQIEPWM